jgi:hypothetical protein
LQNPYIHVLYARARGAIAAAAIERDPHPFWASARRDARRLEREKTPWSCALAGLARAGLSNAQGRPEVAREQLARVLPSLDTLRVGLHAAAARRQLGLLLGGEAGRDLARQAGDWMTAQGIRNPARMAATLLPGFPS